MARRARLAPFTPIPHDFLEALAGEPMPGAHRRVLDVLVRELLGHHRPSLTLTVRHFVDLADLHDRTVRRCLEDLELWRLVIRSRGGRGRPGTFHLRPPRDWRVGRSSEQVRKQRSRMLEAGGWSQLELGLEGVASVTPLAFGPSTSGDKRRRPSPYVRGRPLSHGKEKEISEPERALSRLRSEPKPARMAAQPIRRIEGSAMHSPGHERPQVPASAPGLTEEQRGDLRRRKAARWVLLCLEGVRLPRWQSSPRLEEIARGLTPEQIARALDQVDRIQAEESGQAAAGRTAHAMSHEGKR